MPDTHRAIVDALAFSAKNASDAEVAVAAVRSLAAYIDNAKAVDELAFIMKNHAMKEVRVEAAKSLGNRRSDANRT